jgi:hypothetical protein
MPNLTASLARCWGYNKANENPQSLTIETIHHAGSLANVRQVTAQHGLIIERINPLKREQGKTLWELTLEMDETTDRSLYSEIDALLAADSSANPIACSTGTATTSY